MTDATKKKENTAGLRGHLPASPLFAQLPQTGILV